MPLQVAEGAEVQEHLKGAEAEIGQKIRQAGLNWSLVKNLLIFFQVFVFDCGGERKIDRVLGAK